VERTTLLIFSILVIGVNITALCSLQRVPASQTKTKNSLRWLIGNMYTSGALAGISVACLTTTDTFPNMTSRILEWHSTKTCNIIGIVLFVTFEVTLVLQLAVGSIRMIVTQWPIVGRFMVSRKHAILVAMTAWAGALALALVPVFIFMPRLSHAAIMPSKYCTLLDLSDSSSAETKLFWTAVASANTVCIVMTGVCYGWLSKVVRQNVTTGNTHTLAHKRRMPSLLATVIPVVSVHSVLWLTVMIISVKSYLAVLNQHDTQVGIIYISCVGSAVNPYLYMVHRSLVRMF
jgi:hypothetical protein